MLSPAGNILLEALERLRSGLFQLSYGDVHKYINILKVPLWSLFKKARKKRLRNILNESLYTGRSGEKIPAIRFIEKALRDLLKKYKDKSKTGAVPREDY